MNSDPATLPLRWPWWLLLGYLVGLLAAGGGYYAWLIGSHNLHELAPGRVYRSSQVNDSWLGGVVSRHGIRTIVNLRGSNPHLDWHQEECRAAQRLNLTLQNIHLSAHRLPPASELRRLVQVLDECDYPILVHCRQGSDRSGLVSALILLLQTGATLEEAERQLSLAFGRISLGATAALDDFLVMYRSWLAAEGLDHSPPTLRRWLEVDYCPYGCRAELQWLEPSTTLPVGRPVGLRIRARNASASTWEFRASRAAGVHAVFQLTDAAGQVVITDRAGLLDATIEPGGSIELTIPLPALPAPGAYHLLADLEDGRRGMFFQFGSQPLVRELQAVE